MEPHLSNGAQLANGRRKQARGFVAPVQRLARQAWTRRGIDVTGVMASTSCLVVAPHPDDETLACGATIIRKRQAGTDVTVVVASDGRLGLRQDPAMKEEDLAAVRREETVRACRRLGVERENLVLLDLPDGSLSACVDQLAEMLALLIRERQPDQVLVPVLCDGHPDHAATNRALRLLQYGEGLRQLQVLEYPVWLWTHWPFTRDERKPASPYYRATVGAVARLREVRPLLVDARDHLVRKREALAEYRSQIVPGDPASPLGPEFVRHFLGPHEYLLPARSLDHLVSA